MPESNDHDILLELKSTMNFIVQQQMEFYKQHAELVGRVTSLEKQDSRDSERFRGIADDVRNSLSNASKIETLTADVKNLGDSIRDLKGKSNLWDITNAIGVAIAGALAWFK